VYDKAAVAAQQLKAEPKATPTKAAPPADPKAERSKALQAATATAKELQEIDQKLAEWYLQLGPACALPGAAAPHAGRDSCLRVQTQLRTPIGPVGVEELQVMDEVVALVAGDGLPRTITSDVVPETHCVYRLLLDEDPADRVETTPVRPQGWLRELEQRGKGQVYVELEEMGVGGWARVVEVLPCPPRIGTGKGRLVTGTFRHNRGQVLEVRIAGETEMLGITPSHLVWCVSRAGWVPIGQMEPGERMLAEDGSAPMVLALSLCERFEPV
jgi:hypothetical protein